MNNTQTKLARQFHQNEQGITALETAIILIAFIVAASVFSFAILAAGTASTERGKAAVFQGMAEVRSAMEIRGDVVALSSTVGPTGTVESLVFTLATALGGEPIDLTDTTSGTNKVTIDYLDNGQRQTNLNWTVTWLIDDGDGLLESQELAQITIANLDTQLSNPLGIGMEFTLEIKPPHGNSLTVQRTTPANINQAMVLD